MWVLPAALARHHQEHLRLRDRGVKIRSLKDGLERAREEGKTLGPPRKLKPG